MKTLLKFALGLGLLATVVARSASAAPPATQLITAPLVTPTSAWAYYDTLPATHTNGVAYSAQTPPEIAALARSLGAGRLSTAVFTQNVFDYVRNNIETEFRFGLAKGARGALIDQSGTSFDQAELMVKLLRAGSVSAQFRVGTITLTAAQFGAWTGLVTGIDENAQTFTVNAAAACQLLADGGIPATVNGASSCSGLTGNLTTVVMGHAWVASNTNRYDPAFKRNRVQAGIDIAAAMGCGTTAAPTCGEGIRAALMVNATTGTFAGAPSIDNPNRDGIKNQLRAYALNLENAIKTNNPGAELVDVVGGFERDLSYSPTPGTSLPYTSSAQYAWSEEIPDSFRTTLRVRIGTYDYTFFADEIAGKRVRLMSWSEFFIDKQTLPANGCASCIANTAILDVNHPYSANTGGFADTHGEFLMVDLAEANSTNRGTPPVTFVHGWGSGSAATERYVSDLQNVDPFAGALGSCGGIVGGPRSNGQYTLDGWIEETECENSSQPTLAAKLMHQGSGADKIVQGVTRANITRHHNIGIVYARVWGPTSLSFISVQSALSINSRTSAAADRTAAFEGASAMWAMLEGSLYQQMADQNRALGVAADFMTRGGRFLDVAPGQMATVRAALTPCTTYFWCGDREGRLQDAANNGYSTIMTMVAPGSGGSIFYTSTASSYAVYEGAKGGSALGSANPAALPLQTLNEEPPSWSQANKTSVSLATGEATLTPPPDLITGVGEFPHSLSFQRLYRSSNGTAERSVMHVVNRWHPQEEDNPPATFSTLHEYAGPDSDYSAKIGGAWTHNLEVLARYGNDAPSALGADSGLDAGAVIAGVFALTDAARVNGFSNRLATMFGSAWVGERLMNNHVTVSAGGNSEAFHRLIDGTFNAPPGSGSQLFQTGEIDPNMRDYSVLTFLYRRRDGDEIAFDWSTRSWNGVSFNPAPPLFKATTWTFPDGVVVTFGYQHHNEEYTVPQQPSLRIRNPRQILTSVSNNLGRRLNLNSQVLIMPVESSSGGWYVAGYKLTSVTDENGRSVSFNLSGCPSDRTWACPTLVATSSVGAPTKYEYAANAASPDPAVLLKSNYQLRRVFAPSDQTTTPFNTIRFDELFRVQQITDVLGRVTNYHPGGVVGSELWKRGEVVSALTNPSRTVSTVNVFDEHGNPIAETDAINRTTRYEYDDLNRLTRTTNPEGDQIIRTYDVRSNPLTVVRRAKSGSGLADITTEQNTYLEGPSVRICSNQKSCNKLATTTDARSQITSFSYSAAGLPLTITSPTVPLGTSTGTPRTTLCYTSFTAGSGVVSLLTGKIERVDASATRVTAFAYNTSNKYVLSSSTSDPTTTLSPPAAGVTSCPTSTKSGALNLVSTVTFDAVGNLASFDGPRTDVSDVTNYRFDAARRLTRTDAPLSSITRYTYNIDGERVTSRRAIVASPTDANPADPAPTDLLASHWSTEIREYWPSGTLRSRRDPEGNLTQYSYDELDRLIVTTDPDNRRVATVYDGAGQTLCTWRGWNSTTAPANCTWDPATYVSAGRRGPLRYSSSAYTLNGKQSSVQDADNNVTDYIYDGFDRLAFTLFPDPTTGARCTVAAPVTNASTPACPDGAQQTYEKSTYDSGGNRLTLRTRMGETITWTYDNVSRMSTKAVTGTPALANVTYGYNLLNEQLAIRSPASGSIPAHSTVYDYDAAGRKRFERNLINGLDQQVSYEYGDPNPSVPGDKVNRSKILWPDGYYAYYTYDALNRMQYVRENSATSNELAFYRYDQLSRRRYLCLGGQSVQCQSSGETGGTNRIDYAYELDSNLDLLTHRLNTVNVTLDYGYNASGQIKRIAATDNFYLPAPGGTSTTPYVADRLNRYSSVGGNSTAYDLNGNLLSWGPTASRHTYSYDAENRLRTAVVTGGSSSAYDYDGLGRRLSKTVDGLVTYFLLDGDEEIAEYDGASAVLRRYIMGPAIDDRVAATQNGAISNPVKTYYHVNHQGSVIAMTNSVGAATSDSGCAIGESCQRMSYDEYGNLGTGSVATGQPYRYTGRRFDAETGLYYYRARYYAPVLGRFLQADPIGYIDDFNLYAYVGNDPLNKADPTGTTTTCTPTYCEIVCHSLWECGTDYLSVGYEAVRRLIENAMTAGEDGTDNDGKPPAKPSSDPDVSNNDEPTEALDSLTKLQDKAKGDRPSIDEEGDEDFGTRTRPKQNDINSTEKSEQREKHRNSRIDLDDFTDDVDEMGDEEQNQDNPDDEVDPDLLEKYRNR